jgi:small conductance mechanosensitive channel
MIKLRILAALLGLLLALQGQAQQTEQVEQAEQAEQVEQVELDEEAIEAARVAIEELLQKLEQGIVALQTLNDQIDAVADRDREALILRRDERTFALLLALDDLTRRTAELPADEPQRAELEERLVEDFAEVGDNLLKRIDQIGKRIEKHSAELESLSGSSLIVVQAYIQTLETLRLQYYGAVLDLIEGRTALELPTEDLSQTLQARLYMHAETLAGRVEFSGQALEAVASRIKLEPQNADLATAKSAFQGTHQQNLGHLEAIVALLERMGLNSSVYKSVLVQQGQGLSISEIESDVVVSLVGDAWRTLSQGASARAPDLLFNVVVFALILLVARILSRLTRRAVKAACERPGVDLSTLLKDVLVSVSGGVVTAIGFLMALSQIGISLGPMLAGLGVAGFVVGFALQDTLGNFAAGGMILIYRPYDVDDFIEVVGAAGLVKKMSLVSTTITTFDNQTLVIPNSKIWGDVIKNVTAQKVRRVDMMFGIGYGDDIEQTERVLADILERNEKILKHPDPQIKLHELADSSVNFVVRPWTKTEDYWDVYWEVTREVKMRFDREEISIPFPQRDVHLFTEAGQDPKQA